MGSTTLTLGRRFLLSLRYPPHGNHRPGAAVIQTLCRHNILSKKRSCRAGFQVKQRERNRFYNISVLQPTPRFTHKILAQKVNYCKDANSFDTSVSSISSTSMLDRSSHNLINITPTDNKCFSTAFKSKIAVWNAWSMNKKTSIICDHIISENIDILVLTETWLTANQCNNSIIADITNTLQDYQLFHVPRTSRGGGVCVILRKGYFVNTIDGTVFSSFEHIDLSIASGTANLRLLSVYRPPPSKKNGLTTQQFLGEFSTLIETLTISSGKLLITGDFNFHVDNSDDHDAARFLDILETSGLRQLVTESTHVKGHTLDLLICRLSEELISNIKVSFDLPSDHAIVSSTLLIPRPSSSRLLVNQRNLRKIDMKAFQDDLKNSSLLAKPQSDLISLVNQFNEDLRHVLDVHAPQKTRYKTLRPHAPWFDDLLHQAKQERRRRERKWLSTKLEIHWQLYRDQCRAYKHILNNAKENYHKKKLSECNQRQLFKEVDRLANGIKPTILPSSIDIDTLANVFSDFFSKKIYDLRQLLDKTPHKLLSVVVNESCNSELTRFHPVSAKYVLSLVNKSTIKTCLLDPLPTPILKDSLDVLIISITQIINTSLSESHVPPALKQALVRPVIKKSNLDRDTLTNYRPISNLPFISKTLERVVSKQLTTYLQDNHLFNHLQSAYRKHHSTETALLRVHNDILIALDSGYEVILLLIDFSSAFDTIDHQILLNRLHSKFGITGPALAWFESYLSHRTQSVIVNNTKSSPSVLQYGVPQGSVLGPLLFTLYASPLEDLINSHDIDGMFYADDSQLYLTLKPSTLKTAISKLEICVHDIMAWSNNNKLIFNNTKTEVVHIYSKFSKSTLNIPGVTIDGVNISPADKVKDLGTIVDKNLSMIQHINNICKTSSMALHSIGKIRKYLDKNTCKTLIHAFVTSRLDSCNSLLYGLPSLLLDKLQRIQNSAARLVTGTKRSEHITPILFNLHWLPVRKRIVFKILLLTYKALNGLSPQYLSEILQKNHYQRTRSSASLYVPRTRTYTYGDRAFSKCAPSLWNQLPKYIQQADSVQTFKSQLKTYLFKQHYN